MGLIGKEAPGFCAKAVLNGCRIEENFTLDDFKGKYVLFFFYPLDFTFVCPTEILAFEKKRSAFEERNCEIVGCSIDSHFSHLAWLSMPQSEGGIQGVKYPLVADLTKEIARSFDVLKEDEGIAYRGLFLLDKEGIVRHSIVNDLPLGRSVDEALRMLDSLIFFEKHGEVCPANWHPGEDGMKATTEGVKKYFSKQYNK